MNDGNSKTFAGMTRLSSQQARKPSANEPIRLSEDEEWIEPREWLLGTTFCRKMLSALIGAGAGGKTTIRIAQALSVATGRELTAEKVWIQCPVLFVCMEDDLTELRRRFRAATKFFGISQDELKDIYIWAIKSPKLAVVKDRSRTVIQGGLHTQILTLIQKYGIGLVIFDPFVKIHEVEENDNSAIDSVVNILVQLSEVTNTAVDILHHAPKGITVAGNSEAPRGASALVNGGRLFRTASTMSPEEAKKLGIGDNERKYFIRVDSAKVNPTPPDENTMWFRLESVLLGNTTDTYPNGDNVQTVRRWTPPEQTIGGLAAAIGQLVLDTIDAGLPNGNRYSAARNAPGETALINAFKVVIPDIKRPDALASYDILRAQGRVFEAEYTNSTRNRRTGLYVRGGRVKPPGGGGDDDQAGLFADQEPF
jgi:hypothetical protein